MRVTRRQKPCNELSYCFVHGRFYFDTVNAFTNTHTTYFYYAHTRLYSNIISKYTARFTSINTSTVAYALYANTSRMHVHVVTIHAITIVRILIDIDRSIIMGAVGETNNFHRWSRLKYNVYRLTRISLLLVKALLFLSMFFFIYIHINFTTFVNYNLTELTGLARVTIQLLFFKKKFYTSN